MEGRLRVKRTFGERIVKSETKLPNSVYLIAIASEGKTEEQYFDGIRDFIIDIGSRNSIEIERLEKEDENDTRSHPNHVINLLDERTERWTEWGFSPNELWMIVDRDAQNVSEEQLLEIIKKCKEKGYNLALSNPTFELWLLLHLKDITDYSEEELQKNIKMSNRKRFIDNEIVVLINGKKGNLKFEKFKDGISDAIKRAKQLENDNTSLINTLGTNVHIIVQKITEKQ